ncbi:SIR2 family NAD-dependent protein deacylase [Oceanithermus sp.]
MEEARERLQRAERVAILTGAGISAESGIPTFRGSGGLWEGVRPEELATPQAYARDPEKVWRWYAMRYAQVMEAEPNEAHRLLAELERAKGRGFLLVTQNVDGLHARAGNRRLVELHGNITRARCERCGHRQPLPPPDDFVPPPTCERCGGRMRPDVVWFGEFLDADQLGQAERAFMTADVALVIGTSAVVEPAASLGRAAKASGAYLIEINPEPTPLTPLADLSLRTSASEGLRTLLQLEG